MATVSFTHRTLDISRNCRNTIRKRGLGGAVALALSVLACYGTMTAVAILSVAGITLAVNETIWAGSIVVFALIASVIVLTGKRHHGRAIPGMIALLGFALIAYTMGIHYERAIELSGFALLTIAVFWDWRLRKTPTRR